MNNPFNIDNHLASTKSALESKTEELNIIREEANKIHFNKVIQDAINVNSIDFLEFGEIKSQLDNILRNLNYDASVQNFIENTYNPTIQNLRQIESYKTQYKLAKLNNQFEESTIQSIENAFSLLTVNNTTDILEALRNSFLLDNQIKTQKEITKDTEIINQLEVQKAINQSLIDAENTNNKNLNNYLNLFRANFSSISENTEFLNTFNASCKDAWRAAFNIGHFSSNSMLKSIVNMRNLELKKIINIPSEYFQTSTQAFEIGSSDNLPLNMLINLSELTLINCNICFLPILTLPNLKTLRLVDCYSSKILKGGTQIGIPLNEESYIRIVEPFIRRYPKVQIYGK